MRFQSTRPCGARPRATTRPRCARRSFQSTRPCGARRWSLSASGTAALFQSTRPCGARPAAESHGGQRAAVSIHAPVWGATWSVCRAPRMSVSFNPRARVGRDRALRRAGYRVMWFQSTRPCGARRGTRVTPTPRPRFNPRARVGRDGRSRVVRCSSGRFNPRARVGRDWALSSRQMFEWAFQSTRPCGARPWAATATCRLSRSFNPRARVGRDALKHPMLFPALQFQSTRPCGARPAQRPQRRHPRHVSIHAPVWGATGPARRGGQGRRVSIHAPVWGATIRSRGLARKSWRFNPRARVGRDLATTPVLQIGVWFQSTRPCGARPRGGRRDCGNGRVSIHAPVWGATSHTRLAGVSSIWFQSTRPCGARHHLHDGGDQQRPVSIHAPVWGATGCQPALLLERDVSIHAPVWGATTNE